MCENVGKPAINAGILTPANDLHLDGILHVGKPLEYEPGQFLSKEWFGQTVGSVAGIVPYIIAGRAVGAGSRCVAEATGTEATWFGKFASSEKLTMIAGAGVYDFAREPHKGEARWSNALGGMAMFSLMEFGNGLVKPSMSFADAAITRMKWGAGAGAAGYLTSHVLGPEHSVDAGDLVKSSFTAGLINFGLPAVQRAGARGADFIDNAIIGRGAPVLRHVQANGWGENSVLNEMAANPNARLTRVGGHSDQPKIEGNKITPNAKADEVQQQSDLAHELRHKIARAEQEPKYQQAAFYIDKNDPLHDPREMYINIRRTEEALAQQDGARAANRPVPEGALIGPDGKAPIQDAQHEAQYAREADQFIKEGGTYRPDTSFMGGGGGRGGRDAAVDSLHSSKPESIDGDRIKWDKSTDTWTIYGDPTKAEQTVLQGTGETVDSIQYEYRIEKNAAGQEERVFERITKPNGYLLDGEIWNSVEFYKNGLKTAYGLADRVERLPDGVSVKYRIMKGNPETGVPDGASIDVYPKGLTDPDHGVVQYVMHNPDGSTEYGKPFDLRGYDYPESAPKHMSFGDVIKIDERTDGTTYYQTTDGSSLEHLPAGKEATLWAGDQELGTVNNIFRGADGEVHYQTTDGSNIFVRRQGNEMWLTKQNGAGAPEVPLEVSGPIAEEYAQSAYPNGHEIKSGSTTTSTKRTEIHPEFRRTYTPSSIVDEYATPVQKEYGLVKYTRHFQEMSIDFTTDGARYEKYIKPRNSMSEPVESQPRETVRGMATGMLVDKAGNVTFDLIGRSTPQAGQVSTDTHILGLRTSLNDNLTGAITRVERSGDRALYFTNANEVLDVQLGSNGPILKHTLGPDGQVLSTKQLGTAEIVEYLGENGIMTPFGQARTARVGTDGSIQYQISGDPLDPTRPAPYTDVREFPTPRQTQYGQLTYAEHLRDGGKYRMVFLHSENPPIVVTEAQYRAIVGQN